MIYLCARLVQVLSGEERPKEKRKDEKTPRREGGTERGQRERKKQAKRPKRQIREWKSKRKNNLSVGIIFISKGMFIFFILVGGGLWGLSKCE